MKQKKTENYFEQQHDMQNEDRRERTYGRVPLLRITKVAVILQWFVKVAWLPVFKKFIKLA